MNRQQLSVLLGPVGLLLVLVVIFAGGPASPRHDFFFGFVTGLLVVAAVALLWAFSAQGRGSDRAGTRARRSSSGRPR